MSLYEAILGVSVNFTFNVYFNKQLLTNSQFLMCAVNLLTIGWFTYHWSVYLPLVGLLTLSQFL